jgi:hypothetical protein
MKSTQLKISKTFIYFSALSTTGNQDNDLTAETMTITNN